MKHSFGVSWLLCTFSIATAGCGGGGGGNNPKQNQDAGSDATQDAPTSDAPPNDAATGFGFQPSNLAPDFPIDDRDDMVISGKNCGIVTDPGSSLGIVCEGGAKYTKTVVKQANGPDLMVFSMKSFTIAKDAEVYFDGPLPAVFVVAGKVTIEGSIVTESSTFMSKAAAGGAEGTASFLDGLGLGSGKRADEALKLGGGGASFCGLGGGSNAGAAYGIPALMPLLGGSSGGAGYGSSGAGGGAIQIVAKESIDVTATGVINVGGGGGTFGSGAGSGGAILFEAPAISIAGILAANGGGGAGNGIEQTAGERGQPSGVAALGGKDVNPANQGGNGSDQSSVKGSPGTYVQKAGAAIPDHGGGSGAGAGWIRLNTAGGSATITGTVSPNLGACASEGVIAKS